MWLTATIKEQKLVHNGPRIFLLFKLSSDKSYGRVSHPRTILMQTLRAIDEEKKQMSESWDPGDALRRFFSACTYVCMLISTCTALWRAYVLFLFEARKGSSRRERLALHLSSKHSKSFQGCMILVKQLRSVYFCVQMGFFFIAKFISSIIIMNGLGKHVHINV